MFTATDLASMQATQSAHMMDTCQRLVFTDTGLFDEYNKPLVTYVNGVTLACGVDFSSSKRELLGETQVPGDRTLLRLPFGTVINGHDRVRITHRFGQAITPLLYELLADPTSGPSGLVAPIGLVTNTE